MHEVFKEYCANSTIHGVQHIAERRRHWTERCWWIVAFALSLWFCGSSIQNIWLNWRDNPVTISLTEKDRPVSAIPFPTVTICPETKTYTRQLNVTAACQMLIADGNLSDTKYGNYCALYIIQIAKL